MKFTPTSLPGVVIVAADIATDGRGAFARLYCPDEFAAAGIAFTSTQINLSTNPASRTLRGLHYQRPPHAEAKLVRCVRGRAFDVALDLRPDSPTYRRWLGFELDADTMRAVFLPEGIAHGFLTLAPDTHILYQMGRPFEPGHGEGVRWDDPAFAIDWPAPPDVISERDRTYPDFAA